MSNLHLPYKRFVRQVSNGCARSKYAYQAMMHENALALQSAQWREATCAQNEVGLTVNAVAATDGEFDAETHTWTTQPSYKQYMRDRYDAFMQGGDAVPELATMCGYAGMAAYRFTMPEDAASVALDSIKLLIARDRYCISGVRVAVVLNDHETPTDDWATWDVVRGNGIGAIVSPHEASESVNAESWGFMNQAAVSYLTLSRADEAELDFTAADFPALAATGSAYLWVFLSIEDYSSYWLLFDRETSRYYSIEGSAMLLGGNCEFAFADSVVPDADETVEYGGSIAFYSHDLVGSDSAEGTAELWGNFAQFKNVAALFLPAIKDWNSDPRPSIAALSRFSVFPRKPLFEQAQGWDDAIKVRPVAAVPKGDVGVFACIPQAYVWQDGAYVGIPPTHRGYQYNMFGMGFSVGYSGYGRAGVSGDGKIALPSKLTLQTAIVVVPPNKTTFSRMRLNMEPPTNAFSTNMTGGINVWRCASPDAMGIYAQAALGLLQSYQDLYMRGATSVSGSLSGTGTLTEGVSIKASADNVGYAPIVAGASRIDVTFTSPVQPGDLLLIAPCMEGLSAQPYASGTAIDDQPWPKMGGVIVSEDFI